MPEQEQKLEGRPLDLYELVTRDPQSVAPWWRTNRIVTALAHLLGFDGSQARFLRCDSAGVLSVNATIGSAVPVSPVNVADPTTATQKLAIGATGQAAMNLAGVGGTGLPSGYAGFVPCAGRIEAQGPAGSAEVTLTGAVDTLDLGSGGSRLMHVTASQATRVWESSGAGQQNYPRGVAGPGAPLEWRMSEQYLDFVGSGYAHVVHWSLA